MSTAKDTAFIETLTAIQRLYTALPKPLQIRVERWCDKLSTECASETIRRDRNDLAAALLCCIADEHFVEPFDRSPPEGELAKLPSYSALRARARSKSADGRGAGYPWRPALASVRAATYDRCERHITPAPGTPWARASGDACHCRVEPPQHLQRRKFGTGTLARYGGYPGHPQGAHPCGACEKQAVAASRAPPQRGRAHPTAAVMAVIQPSSMPAQQPGTDAVGAVWPRQAPPAGLEQPAFGATWPNTHALVSSDVASLPQLAVASSAASASRTLSHRGHEQLHTTTASGPASRAAVQTHAALHALVPLQPPLSASVAAQSCPISARARSGSGERRPEEAPGKASRQQPVQAAAIDPQSYLTAPCTGAAGAAHQASPSWLSAVPAPSVPTSPPPVPSPGADPSLLMRARDGSNLHNLQYRARDAPSSRGLFNNHPAEQRRGSGCGCHHGATAAGCTCASEAAGSRERRASGAGKPGWYPHSRVPPLFDQFAPSDAPPVELAAAASHQTQPAPVQHSVSRHGAGLPFAHTPDERVSAGARPSVVAPWTLLHMNPEADSYGYRARTAPSQPCLDAATAQRPATAMGTRAATAAPQLAASAVASGARHEPGSVTSHPRAYGSTPHDGRPRLQRAVPGEPSRGEHPGEDAKLAEGAAAAIEAQETAPAQRAVLSPVSAAATPPVSLGSQEASPVSEAALHSIRLVAEAQAQVSALQAELSAAQVMSHNLASGAADASTRVATVESRCSELQQALGAAQGRLDAAARAAAAAQRAERDIAASYEQELLLLRAEHLARLQAVRNAAEEEAAQLTAQAAARSAAVRTKPVPEPEATAIEPETLQRIGASRGSKPGAVPASVCGQRVKRHLPAPAAFEALQGVGADELELEGCLYEEQADDRDVGADGVTPRLICSAALPRSAGAASGLSATYPASSRAQQGSALSAEERAFRRIAELAGRSCRTIVDRGARVVVDYPSAGRPLCCQDGLGAWRAASSCRDRTGVRNTLSSSHNPCILGGYRGASPAPALPSAVSRAGADPERQFSFGRPASASPPPAPQLAERTQQRARMAAEQRCCDAQLVFPVPTSHQEFHPAVWRTAQAILQSEGLDVAAIAAACKSGYSRGPAPMPQPPPSPARSVEPGRSRCRSDHVELRESSPSDAPASPRAVEERSRAAASPCRGAAATSPAAAAVRSDVRGSASALRATAELLRSPVSTLAGSLNFNFSPPLERRDAQTARSPAAVAVSDHASRFAGRNSTVDRAPAPDSPMLSRFAASSGAGLAEGSPGGPPTGTALAASDLFRLSGSLLPAQLQSPASRADAAVPSTSAAGTPPATAGEAAATASYVSPAVGAPAAPANASPNSPAAGERSTGPGARLAERGTRVDADSGSSPVRQPRPAATPAAIQEQVPSLQQPPSPDAADNSLLWPVASDAPAQLDSAASDSGSGGSSWLHHAGQLTQADEQLERELAEEAEGYAERELAEEAEGYTGAQHSLPPGSLHGSPHPKASGVRGLPSTPGGHGLTESVSAAPSSRLRPPPSPAAAGTGLSRARPSHTSAASPALELARPGEGARTRSPGSESPGTDACAALRFASPPARPPSGDRGLGGGSLQATPAAAQPAARWLLESSLVGSSISTAGSGDGGEAPRSGNSVLDLIADVRARAERGSRS